MKGQKLQLVVLLFILFIIPIEFFGRGYRYVTINNKYAITSQIKNPNFVYIISETIDLKDQRLIIPDNCVLMFRGGKLCNGTIVGNNTIIDADKTLIMENVEIDKKGSWNNKEGYPEWFGASNNVRVDSKMAIQKAIDVANTCVLTQEYYTSFDTRTSAGSGASLCAIAIKGRNIIGKKGNKLYIDAKFSNTERTSVFWIGDDVTIDGVNIQYLHEDHSGWTGKQAGVYRIEGGNVTIQNTTLRGAMAAWINILGSSNRCNYRFRNNYVHDCDCGLIIQGGQHTPGELYSMNLLMDNNVIEKEKERHSEFVSFWGRCKEEGTVYYTDVTIRRNKFSGGWKGGCIIGRKERNGLKKVVISDNVFFDCGSCSFYNADGMTYVRNHVTGSTFLERQVKGIMGSYPNLSFTNCTNCVIDDVSCFGLSFDNCKDMKIGKIRQTLCLDENDPYLEQKDFITNFIGVRADNSIVSIKELIVSPYADERVKTDKCKYYIFKASGSEVNIKKMRSCIPVQDSKKLLKIKSMK